MNPNPLEQNALQFLAASGAMGLLSSWILQGMKKSPLKGFNLLGVEPSNARMNLLASIVLAFFAAVGIHTDFGFDATGFHGAFNGTWYELAHGLGQWVWQAINNHAAYKLFIVPPEIQGRSMVMLEQLVKDLTSIKERPRE